MATLLLQPGTVENPARLGEPVTLRSEPPGLFGLTEGKVELVCGADVIAIPSSDVTWDPTQIVAPLPTAVPQLEGPFQMRVTPGPVSTPAVLEGPIQVLPDIKTALEDIPKRLRLLVGVGDSDPIGQEEIYIQPKDLDRLCIVLEAPKTVVRRQSETGAVRTRSTPLPPVPRRPIVSKPTIGTLVLQGLPTVIAQALDGAHVTAEVRLVASSPRVPLRDEEVSLEPRTDILGFDVFAAPHIVELGSPGPNRTINIQARVTVQAALPGQDEPIVSSQQVLPPEPVKLHLQPLGMPTMLALFRHRNYLATDGFVLVVVPPGSNLSPTTAPLPGSQGKTRIVNAGPLDPTTGVLLALKERLPALAPVIDRLGAILAMIEDQDHFVLARAPIPNLNDIRMIDRSGVLKDTEAEDQVSALMLFGRPGTRAKLFCKRNCNAADGRLDVEVAQTVILPFGLVALPTLPQKPVAAFDGLPGLPVLDPDVAKKEATINVVKECQIEDKATGKRVFADTFSSVELVRPPD